MRFSVIASDFVASIKTWLRSKGTLFWTLAFPVMLILIFGAIFSGIGDSTYSLYIQDLDDSDMSASLIDTLEETGVIKLTTIDYDGDIMEYIDDNNIDRLIVIPKGYQQRIQQSFADENVSVDLLFYINPAEQTSNQIVMSIVSGIIQSMNMEFTGGRNVVVVDHISTISDDLGFFDFFLPGIIGLTIMQSCVYGSIERNTKFRKNGILRKLLTTPITRSEWILSKMLFMLFLSFVSTFLIIGVGLLIYNITISFTIYAFVIIIATSFLFSGLGMLIGRFVKDEETADTAGGAITFPMMFLAGTFYSLEMMPDFLQMIARFMPLYYVNEGLRNAMTYMNQSEALFHMVVVIVFALVFFIAGVALTKWDED
ncbi:MAG: ABC transporter permease [Thermoplasmatota archaeon]